MRWFTDEAHDAEDDRTWDRMLAAYADHLTAIAPKLPPDAMALATDAKLHLHDAEFIEVAVDPSSRRIEMVVRLGNEDRSWLRLRFRDAEIVPENYQLLRFAVGARYASGVISVILDQEIDVLPSDRLVLRLRLWPFHEFTIEFGVLALDRLPPSERRRNPGRFVLTGTEGRWNVPSDRRLTFLDAD